MQFLTSRFASIGFSVDGGAPINLGKKNPDSCEPGAKVCSSICGGDCKPLLALKNI
jgi:hypothetical protein